MDEADAPPPTSPSPMDTDTAAQPGEPAAAAAAAEASADPVRRLQARLDAEARLLVPAAWVDSTIRAASGLFKVPNVLNTDERQLVAEADATSMYIRCAMCTEGAGHRWRVASPSSLDAVVALAQAHISCDGGCTAEAKEHAYTVLTKLNLR